MAQTAVQKTAPQQRGKPVLWLWEATLKNGEVKKGEMEAGNAEAVNARLRSLGYQPTLVRKKPFEIASTSSTSTSASGAAERNACSSAWAATMCPAPAEAVRIRMAFLVATMSAFCQTPR